MITIRLLSLSLSGINRLIYFLIAPHFNACSFAYKMHFYLPVVWSTYKVNLLFTIIIMVCHLLKRTKRKRGKRRWKRKRYLFVKIYFCNNMKDHEIKKTLNDCSWNKHSFILFLFIIFGKMLFYAFYAFYGRGRYIIKEMRLSFNYILIIFQDNKNFVYFIYSACYKEIPSL